MLHVASLHIYPVKACGGVELDRMTLDARGPVGDRRFMIVDESGRFVTQREEPSLAMVRARLTSGGLALETPGADGILVASDDGRRQVSVWRSKLEAMDTGDEAASWLSDHLGRPVRLVRMADDVTRPIDAPFGGGATSVAFADGFPLLVTHEASLEELNTRLDTPVTMSRFRPNLVVAGGEPWEEDGWSRLTIGDLQLQLVKPCERCKVVNVDPTTGTTGREPLRTLATYRCVTEGAVVVGQNAVHEGPGTLERGASVTVA